METNTGPSVAEPTAREMEDVKDDLQGALRRFVHGDPLGARQRLEDALRTIDEVLGRKT